MTMAKSGYRSHSVFKFCLVASLCVSVTTATQWTKIFGCTLDDIFTFEGGMHGIADIARTAASVRICTAGSNTDCVTSQPNSFPILNLRSGLPMLGHINGAIPCDASCVQKYWTGPSQRLANLETRCQGGVSLLNVFQSCGNRNGLHFTLNKASFCTWNYSLPTRRIAPGLDVFIDQNSASPTQAPIPSPTSFFQAPDHQTNFIEVQTRLTAVEELVTGMTAMMKLLANQTFVNDQVTAIAGEFENVKEALEVQTNLIETNFTEVRANITVLQSTTSQVQTALQALKTATTKVTSSTAASMSSIEDVDFKMKLSAPDSIALRSGTCGVDDLCEISAFAERLAAALDTI
eukprot:m.258049 g.258049  ORF g.258049 m.258049 type:complete len:348 (-) comp36038_c0_seq1:257-1300(-)